MDPEFGENEAQEYPQPVYALKDLRNKQVLVGTVRGAEITGELLAFDLSLNLSLVTEEGQRFLRGTDVLFVASLDNPAKPL